VAVAVAWNVSTMVRKKNQTAMTMAMNQQYAQEATKSKAPWAEEEKEAYFLLPKVHFMCFLIHGMDERSN
jgi:hypothetical protein